MTERHRGLGRGLSALLGEAASTEAPSFGKPVLIYDLKCTGSQAYLRLAKEVVGRERARRAAVAA